MGTNMFEIKDELVDCPVLDCDGRIAYELDGKTYCCSDPKYFCQRKRMALMNENKIKNLKRGQVPLIRIVDDEPLREAERVHKYMKVIVALTALVFVINVAAFAARIMGA